MNIIDIEYAKSVLDYNPKTGLFYSKISSRKKKVGWKSAYGYTLILIGKKHLKAHRVAWAMYYNEQPKEIDHINGIKDDNRIANLRECTRSQNQANRSAPKNNKSGVKGVCWCNRSGKWIAQLRKNMKCIHLGYFEKIEDASSAYAEAAKIHFVEFSRTE